MSSSFGSMAPSSSFNFGAPQGRNPFHNNNTRGNANNLVSNFSNQNVFQKDKNKKQTRQSKPSPKKKISPTNPNIAPTTHKRFMMAHNQQVSNVGSLISDPTQLGFIQQKHKPREVPRFLISQQPQLKPKPFEQDHWDRINQTKMVNLENSIQDMTELYEKLKKMRDTERKIMEDKGLVDKADSAKDLNDAIVFQGTCLDMCPTFERARRNVEYTVYSYEKDHPDDKKASRSKALKVFARPAAAAAPPLPSDVRPPHILVKTLDYLIENLLSTLPDSEGFLWDRMRSIRQDFTYQNYCGPEAVDCNERIVRIHLLVIHVMVKSEEQFSLQQELEQLHKSLITLSEIYDDVRASGGYCPNEAEFRAYALLSKIRDPQYDKTIQDLPNEILENDLVQMALCFRRIISNSNFIERGYVRTENCLNFYSQFFKLIQSSQVPFLLSSFLEIYLNEIRFYAIKAVSHSMNKKHKPIPTNLLIDELMFNNYEEFVEFSEYYSIVITKDGVDLKSLTAHSHRLPEKKPLRNHYLECVDEKLNATSYSNIINSGILNVDSLSDNNEGLPNVITIEDEPLNGEAGPSTATVLPKTTGFFDSLKTNTQNKVSNLNPDITHQINTLQQPSTTTSIISGQAAMPKLNGNGLEPKAPTVPPSTSNQTGNSSTSSFFSFNQAPVGPITTNVESSNVSVHNTPANNKNKIEHQKPKENNEKKQLELEEIQIKEKQRQDESRKQQEIQKLKAEKEVAKNKAATIIADSIIKSVVNKQCESVVKQCINERNNKSLLLKELTDELYDAFIHEKLYIIFLEATSDSHRNKYLQRVYMKRWITKLKKNQELVKERKKKKLELKNLENQLGVPNMNKSKRLLHTPVNNGNINNNSSFLIHSTVKGKDLFSPVTNESNQFSLDLVKKTGSLWKPFDIKALYFDNIFNKYYNKMKTSSDIFLYSKSWNTVSGSWILSKFGLPDPKSISTVGNDSLRLNIRCIDETFDPSEFKETQLVIFNTGVTDDNIFDLEMKLQQDGEDLIKLVTGITLNTNINFNLLLIYWESSETKLPDSAIAKYLKLSRIDRNFNGILDNIGFVKVNEDSPDASLERGLVKISQSFQYKLTDRGKYQESLISKRNQRVTSQEKQLKVTKSIDDKMKRMLDAEKDAYKKQISDANTYAHLQAHIASSPKMRKRKLPVLVSETKSNKFKTPMGSKMRYSSLVSTDSMAQQSHLAMKVRNGATRVVSQNGPLPSGTPSHSTNIPGTTYNPHIIPSFGSSVGNNNSFHDSSLLHTTHDSHVFRTPSNAIAGDTSGNSPPQPPRRKSSDLQELKSLIASVKKRVNPDE
ncbi:hypothetical protein C6P45_000677 [Maudiozyma exigua]|uniref:Nuclear mRNA export factor n=1 Tax=Maudiozyma exigua TaxID=34358 RepID=A0A9P6W510_MAUEX|nr:hypothetical protein C6P45_000677 [Kazachstania exigua]